MTMFRYIRAALDHLIHYTLAPAHLKVDNKDALARLQQIDRDIAAGRYKGADVKGTRAFTFYRLPPRERLLKANAAITARYTDAHAPLTNPVAPIPTPARNLPNRRGIAASNAYAAPKLIPESGPEGAVFRGDQPHAVPYDEFKRLPRFTTDRYLDGHAAGVLRDPD